MKNKICKRIIIIVTLFFLANPLFGQLYSSGISFGTDLDISENGVNMGIDLSLFSMEIQTDIGLGFGIDFIKYNYISNNPSYICIFNPHVFWNVLRLFPSYYEPFIDPVTGKVNRLLFRTFGPFVSIAPTIAFRNYIFSTGLRFTEQNEFSYYYHIEAGYKYIYDKNIGSFYLSIKFDIPNGLILIPVLFGASA